MAGKGMSVQIMVGFKLKKDERRVDGHHDVEKEEKDEKS